MVSCNSNMLLMQNPDDNGLVAHTQDPSQCVPLQELTTDGFTAMPKLLIFE